MADSKYADLPGIAKDQPDVYETDDLPESDQNTNFCEEESDSIERLHISASEAFSKFKGKLLNAGVVDFSDRLSKARRTGYDARSGDWELIGEGEKETPLQKFQRLQCEMRELCEELAHRKESVKDEKSQDQKELVFLANQVEQAQKQLADIKLEETLGTELVANLADPQEAHVKKALSLIEDLKRGGDKFGDVKNVAVLDQKNMITFQLNYRPEHARFSQTTRLAELEQRLHKMEAVLGMEPQKLTRLSLDSQRRSLLEVAESLSARANLLDSAQLDHIEGRLIALTQNMDSLAEKTGTCEDADKQRKVVELYEMVKKTETLSQVLPQVLERMTALDHLHQQAANISKSLTQLEDLQQHITTGLDNNESLLQGIQASLATNLDSIKKTIANLEKRLAHLDRN